MEITPYHNRKIPFGNCDSIESPLIRPYIADSQTVTQLKDNVEQRRKLTNNFDATRDGITGAFVGGVIGKALIGLDTFFSGLMSMAGGLLWFGGTFARGKSNIAEDAHVIDKAASLGRHSSSKRQEGVS
ncbi:MAG: hypothetical protein KTR14_05750 [Vampirovibrio sp.]|nr:hypothetical protein [Vampirovibrio sp.]